MEPLSWIGISGAATLWAVYYGGEYIGLPRDQRVRLYWLVFVLTLIGMILSR